MEHYIVLGLIGCALVLFAFELLRPDLVALVVLLALLLLGYVNITEGFSGFSNPAVITVIAMFILSAGLIRTGVTDAIADFLLRVGGGGNPVVLTAAVMLTVGVMSAFMNNIGAVAVLIPAMFVIAEKSNYPVNRLLIPLSFASLMGGLVTVIGTPPNLLVSMALEEHGFEGFKLFDFAPTGLAILATGVIYMSLFGRKLIAVRTKPDDLARQYQLQDYLSEVVVPSGSSLVGKTLAQAELTRRLGLTVLRMIRKQEDGSETVIFPRFDSELQEGDRLVVEGQRGEILKLGKRSPVQLYSQNKFALETLGDQDLELAEVIVAPNSRLIGRTIAEIDVRRRFGVLVLAFRRRGENRREKFVDISLQVGDVLLVQGPREVVSRLSNQHDIFLTAHTLEHENKDHSRAWLAVGILGACVLSAACGLLHISVAGLVGVLLMGITGCVKVDEMYRAVEWRVVFLIACMMPLGIAMDNQHTGTAAWLAGGVIEVAGAYGPWVMMAALFLFATLITEVMSNAAAAVLLAPIGIAIAVGMGIEPHAFLVAIAIGASTTFLSPIGHQSNVLVYGAGNYRFSDFPKVGALLNLAVFVVSILIIPVFWPFTPLA